MTPNGNVIEVVVSLVDQITKPLNSITNSIGRVGSLIGIAIGGWSLNKFIANINEAEQVAAKLDVAYRNLGAASGVTRARMDELASELQNTTTFSDEAVKSAEALLLTFTRVRGEAFEKTIKVAADLSTMMGMDLTSAVRMLGRAAQDPTRGFYMLQRAGVVLTAGQKAMIKEMTAAGDAAGAYGKLLELVGKKVEGTATAMRNTLGGAITGLQNAIGDLVEGDSGSFASAVDAINELTKSLSDPKFKAAGDAAIQLMVRLGGAAAFAAASVVNATVAVGEFAALKLSGSADVIEQLNTRLEENLTKQEKAAERVRGMEQALASGRPRQSEVFKERLVAVRAELEALRKEEATLRTARAQELRDQALQVTGGRKATAPKPQPMTVVGQTPAALNMEALKLPPLKLGAELDAAALEEIGGNVHNLQKELRTEVEKTADGIAAQLRIIAQAYLMTDEQLAEVGLKREDLDPLVAKLQTSMTDTIKKAAGEIDVLKAAGLEEIVINAKQIGQSATDALFTEMEAASRTGFEQQMADWRAFLAELDELQQRGSAPGGISASQAAARAEERRKALAPVAALDDLQRLASMEGLTDDQRALQEQIDATVARVQALGAAVAQVYALSDDDLLKLGYTRDELDAMIAHLSVMVDKAQAATQKTSEFAVQAARNVQTFFADAFMSIGEGWQGTVRSFLQGFQRIIAEAAAMRLAEAMGLDDLFSGKTATRGLGKVLQGVFPAKGTKTGPATAGAAVGGAVVSATGGSPDPAACAAGCAGEVAKAVGTEMSTTVGAQLKEMGGGLLAFLKDIGGGLWKFFTEILKQIWAFIKGVVEVIRGMGASSSSGSSSGGIIAGIVGMFAGGSAGGGIIPAGKPRRVGEEGEEWIVPLVPSKVINERQMAYAGGGGGSLEYAPSYNFTINGAKDDRAMAQQMMAFVERQDQKNKVEIMEMLRRNGFGRMTR